MAPLWARDELAGVFKSLGQFSKGSNDNEGLECLLKMWDGGASFVDRMDSNGSSFVAEETRLNIAGGIQPKAFRQAFKDPDDPQGIQARFLYAIPQIHPAKRVKGYCQLSDILPAFYDWCDACPQGTIKLSREADLHYSQLVEQIGRQTEKSPSPALRAWMRKLPSQLLRIALGLHMIHYYYDKKSEFLGIASRYFRACSANLSATTAMPFKWSRRRSADSNAISFYSLKDLGFGCHSTRRLISSRYLSFH